MVFRACYDQWYSGLAMTTGIALALIFKINVIGGLWVRGWQVRSCSPRPAALYPSPAALSPHSMKTSVWSSGMEHHQSSSKE
eukprot:1155987-Pelagomonas_calceolata.AAC.4